MPTITIKNVGPVKEATLDLNKINVFMGPQSSGKSTVAKIISHCTWVEKDVATDQSLDEHTDGEELINHLENFHKMKGYFKPESIISYKSNTIEIDYISEKLSIRWVDQYAYFRSKISYIPSERNMVILPEVEKVQFPNNNIRSFIFDWLDSRKNHPKDENLTIPGLGMSFYYSENSRESHIIGKEDEAYDILLSDASSGLQSITPLVTVVNNLTHWIYENGEDASFERMKKIKNAGQRILSEVTSSFKQIDNNINVVHRNKELNALFEQYKKGDKSAGIVMDYFGTISDRLFKVQNSQFIIEEPEQNLFPQAQRDLIYYLLEKCQDEEKDHRMTITTHSPYILYALNNCMLGKLVENKLSDEEWNHVKCRSSLIDPQKVSIHQIENGELKPIQQNDGLIGENYFDANMKEIMDDYYMFLNHYDDEE